MASLCTICCDSNNVSKILCKCEGNICINCINEILIIKEYSHNIINCVLEYCCPFCKNNNQNILDHIKLLNNNTFNKLISDKINNYNEHFRHNTNNTIINLEEEIEELQYNVNMLEDRIQKNTSVFSLLDEKFESLQFIMLKEQKEKNELENKNKKLLLEIKKLNKLQNNYYCITCNKYMNKSSKYSHNKCKKHIDILNNYIKPTNIIQKYVRNRVIKLNKN